MIRKLRYSFREGFPNGSIVTSPTNGSWLWSFGVGYVCLVEIGTSSFMLLLCSAKISSCVRR